MNLVRLLATFVAAAGVLATSSAAEAAVYWDRPWAEHELLVRQVVGVAPIIDAHCQGINGPRFTARGARRYSAFSCKALTNVGGRAPWVVVVVTPTSTSTFTARAT